MNLKRLYLLLYGSWVVADIIAAAYYFVRTQDGGGISGELVLRHAVGLLPFPFGLIAEWAIDPSAIMLQVIIFSCIAGSIIIFIYGFLKKA